MKGAIWIFILSHFILEPRKATIIEALINGFILCIQPKQCLKEAYYCLRPRYKTHPSQRSVPVFFLSSLSSKISKTRQASVAAFKEWGLCSTKPEVPAASWWAWRWGQGGVGRQKSSRGSAGEGCSPTFLRQTFPSLNYTQLSCKNSFLGLAEGLSFQSTHPWKNTGMSDHSVDNQSAAPRERTRTPWVIRQYSVHVYPPSMKLLRSLMSEAA